MSVTLNLAPEIEKSLTDLAQAESLTLSDYLTRLLSEKTALRQSLSAAERAKIWRESMREVPGVALSDEAMRRSSMYDSRR